jgi:hypothetical protein
MGERCRRWGRVRLLTDARPQTSKACEVQASVGSNPTATASLNRRNAGPPAEGAPGVRRLVAAWWHSARYAAVDGPSSPVSSAGAGGSGAAGGFHLDWPDDPAQVSVAGGEPEASAALPLRAPGKRFARYTSAIKYLDPPKLFENRTSYRLLDVNLRNDPHTRFGLGTYFDKLDLSEAVAHELATANATAGYSAEPPAWDAMPLRALVGDPFDLRRRHLRPAIETLTLRRNRKTGEATFLLHWRDPAKVATAAGIYGLIPAGEFQPSTIATHDRENDFSLWRSMVREYSEELLGEPERDGSSGEVLDYDDWPLYRSLEQARADGRVTPYCLGTGLDTLTLTPTILTVTVFDHDIFDELFGNTVAVNAEGRLVSAADSTSVTDGIPFDDESVTRLLNDEPMASPGACILSLAHSFRTIIRTRH